MDLGGQRRLPSTDPVRWESGLESQVDRKQQKRMIASPASDDMGGSAEGSTEAFTYTM